MSTKYAKARDVAYQWRTECRKVKQENKSLRKVFEASRQLTAFLKTTQVRLPIADAIAFDELVNRLEAVQRSAVFAVDGQQDNAPVAQRKEQLNSSQRVEGSNPSGRATKDPA